MGFWVTTFTFILWGLMPPYWKLFSECDPLELIAHRVFWSFICVALVFTAKGDLRPFLEKLKDKKSVRLHLLSAFLLLINWLTFVWAIIHNRIIDTSLGYYLVPLLNVCIGHFLLGEELRLLRKWAVAIAALGIGILFFMAGKIPMPAVVLSVTFSLYGLISKHTTLGAMQRMGMESLLLLPIAAGYLIWISIQGHGILLGEQGTLLQMLVPTTGIQTVIPLVMFTWGAQRVELSTVGLLQFIAPSLTFLTAVFLFKEPFATPMISAFTCIWAALTLYSIDLLKNSRSKKVI
jgi:chloramphenicol-sensitive protein RarD